MPRSLHILLLSLSLAATLCAQSVRLDSGLVAYYPFNGNANDASGNGHHGVTNSGISWTADRLGRVSSASDFAGDSAMIGIPHHPHFDLTGDFSICLWIRPTWIGSSPWFITKGAAVNSAYRVANSWLFADQSLRVTAVYFGTVSSPFWTVLESKLNAVHQDTWSFVVFTYAASSHAFAFYVNGQHDTSGVNQLTIAANDRPVTIGDSVQYFRGQMDDIRFYDRAITSVEVDSLYHEAGWTTAAPATATIPIAVFLPQNFPNPFNSSTHIEYWLSREAHVELKVYDVLGREVSAIVNSLVSAGIHVTTWNAANAPSGIYVCRMTVEGLTTTRRMVLMR